MTAANTVHPYHDVIKKAIPYCLKETLLPLGIKTTGKVRDLYHTPDHLIMIATDRLSAFDRHLAHIPYKGQILNEISAWWFKKTKHIVSNHVLAVPDPNAMIAKKCKVLSIEFVMRGYLTGSTQTALWTQYQKGVRSYCGHALPEGMRKNERLNAPILTPTTKEKDHDRPISPVDIIKEGFLSQQEWEEASHNAMKLYQYGVEESKKHGLILVDTKYEFGRDENGHIVLIDELHTPDSSRYWLADSYEEGFVKGKEPENFDKEFLRLWFAEHTHPYTDAHLPDAPEDLIVTLSSRYIQLYEMITGKQFLFRGPLENIAERINKNLSKEFVT